MYKLPESLREKLRTSIGQLVVDETKLIEILRNKAFLVTIGDIVTLTLVKHGLIPDICVVDFKTRRGECDVESKKLLLSVGKAAIKVKNPPARISDELWDAIKKAYEKIGETSVRIEVDGEDDLASLPAIFLAPGDVTIIYGLPNKGILLVDATDKNKEKVRRVLDEMKNNE